MDDSMIRDMNRFGVAHTRSHPRPSWLVGEAMREERNGFNKNLDKQPDRKVERHWYPYGDWDGVVKVEVKKRDIDSRLRHEEAMFLNKIDFFSLPRIPIDLVTNTVSFHCKIIRMLKYGREDSNRKREAGQKCFAKNHQLPNCWSVFLMCVIISVRWLLAWAMVIQEELSRLRKRISRGIVNEKIAVL